MDAGTTSPIILNLRVTVWMKKAPSKSTFTKKNKTLSNVPDSKKSSRIVKANSCVKINSINSEQNSRHQPLTQVQIRQNVSQKQILPHEISQLSHLIDKPQASTRLSQRNQGKSSVETIPIEHRQSEAMARLREKNEQVTRENTTLKQKCCQLQQMSLRDKEKIKNLIIRINEVKNSNQASESKQLTAQTYEMKRTQPSNGQLLIFNQHDISAGRLTSKPKIETPYKAINNGPCENKQCLERKKYLEGELYRERILRDKLQMERREWQHNKADLKQQYNELLLEIQDMREKEY